MFQCMFSAYYLESNILNIELYTDISVQKEKSFSTLHVLLILKFHLKIRDYNIYFCLGGCTALNVKVKFTNTAPSTFINRENNEDFWNTEIGSVMKVVKCCYNSSIQFC